MGERDKGEGRAILLPWVDRAALVREHKRKLHLLRRLSDALGRPVEDFYATSAESDSSKDKEADNSRE